MFVGGIIGYEFFFGLRAVRNYSRMAAKALADMANPREDHSIPVQVGQVCFWVVLTPFDGDDDANRCVEKNRSSRCVA